MRFVDSFIGSAKLECVFVGVEITDSSNLMSSREFRGKISPNAVTSLLAVDQEHTGYSSLLRNFYS
jgi:hypothetical protein